MLPDKFLKSTKKERHTGTNETGARTRESKKMGWELVLDICLGRLLVFMAHFYVPVGAWCVVTQTESARDIRDRKDGAGV